MRFWVNLGRIFGRYYGGFGSGRWGRDETFCERVEVFGEAVGLRKLALGFSPPGLWRKFRLSFVGGSFSGFGWQCMVVHCYVAGVG